MNGKIVSPYCMCRHTVAVGSVLSVVIEGGKDRIGDFGTQLDPGGSRRLRCRHVRRRHVVQAIVACDGSFADNILVLPQRRQVGVNRENRLSFDRRKEFPACQRTNSMLHRVYAKINWYLEA